MTMKQLIENIESEPGPKCAIVHQLLELALAVTGRGEIGDDYTKTIDFPMNDYWIVSDLYYGRIDICSDDEEFILVDDEMIMKLAAELKKRLLEFDTEIGNVRDKLAGDIFDRSISHVIPEEGSS